MKANYHEVFNLNEKCWSAKLVKSENNRYYFQCPRCGGEMTKKGKDNFSAGMLECTGCGWSKS